MKQVVDYLEASLLEFEMNEQYKKLNLSYEQRKVITQWKEAIQGTGILLHGCCFPRGYAAPFFPTVATNRFKVTENRRYSSTF